MHESDHVYLVKEFLNETENFSRHLGLGGGGGGGGGFLARPRISANSLEY